MKPFTLIVLASFAGVAAAVAVRLLGLAARTRKAPELLLGLSLLLPVSGYVAMVVSAVVFGGKPAPLVIEIGGVFIDVGFLCVAGFVWVVFRRDEAWAGLLAGALALTGLSMPVVNHAVPWSEGLPSALWPRAVVRTLSCGWAAFEALRYAALMRRRVRFGLAEPLVAERFVLWGVSYLCLTVMLDLFTAGATMHMRGSTYGDVFTVGGAAFGAPAALMLALSFFPPKVYVRHIDRRARLEGGA